MAATMIRHTDGFGTGLDVPFGEAITRVKAAQQGEGFGVLSAIDVQATLQAKRGGDFERYTIPGAGNPTPAHRALQAEHDLGLLLPGNAIVHDRDGGSGVAIVDPDAMLGVVEHAALGE